MNAVPRIALIHALAHSIAPVNAELDRSWPECVRMNLLDDSLSADLARSATGLDARMTARFVALAAYAIGTGAQGILFDTKTGTLYFDADGSGAGASAFVIGRMPARARPASVNNRDRRSALACIS